MIGVLMRLNRLRLAADDLNQLVCWSMEDQNASIGNIEVGIGPAQLDEMDPTVLERHVEHVLEVVQVAGRLTVGITKDTLNIGLTHAK